MMFYPQDFTRYCLDSLSLSHTHTNKRSIKKMTQLDKNKLFFLFLSLFLFSDLFLKD
jgi:hypothetical protein